MADDELIIMREDYGRFPVLTEDEWTVLRALEELRGEGGWHNKQSVCQRTRLDSKLVSQLIDAMVADGLVDLLAHTRPKSQRLNDQDELQADNFRRNHKHAKSRKTSRRGRGSRAQASRTPRGNLRSSPQLVRAEFHVISTRGRNVLRVNGARLVEAPFVYGIPADLDRDERRAFRFPISKHGNVHKMYEGYRFIRPWKGNA